MRKSKLSNKMKRDYLHKTWKCLTKERDMSAYLNTGSKILLLSSLIAVGGFITILPLGKILGEDNLRYERFVENGLPPAYAREEIKDHKPSNVSGLLKMID
jgi:hypothetical protein